MSDLSTDSMKIRVISLSREHPQRVVESISGVPQSTISDFLSRRTYKSWWKRWDAKEGEGVDQQKSSWWPTEAWFVGQEAEQLRQEFREEDEDEVDDLDIYCDELFPSYAYEDEVSTEDKIDFIKDTFSYQDSFRDYPLVNEDFEGVEMTYECGYGKVSVSIKQGDLCLQELVDNVIRPLLLGATYSVENVNEVLGEPS